MERVFEYREHWLVRRSDTPAWYIYWCRPGTRRVLRRSTGTGNLEEAKRVLIDFADRPTVVVAAPAPARPAMMPASPNHQLPRMQASGDVGVPVLDILAGYVERLRGRSSHEAARNALRAWIEFCTRDNVVYVHEMTLPVQERFVAWRRHTHPRGKLLSNGTINRGLDVLRAALHDAWRRGQLTGFPHVRLIPKPPPRDLFLTREEVQRLLTACTEPHLYRFVMLAAHTLQRPSAILNLRVEQVDLTWNRINFLPPGGVQSNKRRPIVPITATLRPVLEQAIAASASGFVIEYDGQPIKKLKQAFRTAARRAGLPHATPGILRHTGATLLAAAGVPLREISGMLGHTTSRITEEVYAKRRPEFLAGAVGALDGLFAQGALQPEPTGRPRADRTGRSLNHREDGVVNGLSLRPSSCYSNGA
jgi:integrase